MLVAWSELEAAIRDAFISRNRLCDASVFSRTGHRPGPVPSLVRRGFREEEVLFWASACQDAAESTAQTKTPPTLSQLFNQGHGCSASLGGASPKGRATHTADASHRAPPHDVHILQTPLCGLSLLNFSPGLSRNCARDHQKNLLVPTDVGLARSVHPQLALNFEPQT